MEVEERSPTRWKDARVNLRLSIIMKPGLARLLDDLAGDLAGES